MKLLVITQKVDKRDENLGSFHRWLEEFAKHFDRVTVIANSEGKHSLPANVEVYSLGKERGISRFKKVYKFLELFSHYYARADGVFFHMIPEFVLVSSPFLISHSKPSVLWYVHKSTTWKLKWAEKLVRYIFTASELSFRLPSKKVIYSGHAIDTEMFKPGVTKYSPVLKILSVGRISPVKSIETLLKACAILRNSWPRQWALSLVGGPILERDREYLSTLKKFVREERLENNVIFHGPRPYTEILDTYRDHDMFISMSTTGSIDKAVLEAMSCGLTTITPNEAFYGILKPPYFLEKRSPELLASRIKMLADENRPRHDLRELVVNSHSLSRTVERIVRCLRSKKTTGL